jgi:hypothetical protein
MIRFLLLGGRWGPVPAPAFLALAGACLGAALLSFLYTLGSAFETVGRIEAGIFAIAGVTLLSVGLHRRRHPPKEPRGPWGREELLP